VGVAKEFAIRLESRDGEPDDRIEPVHRIDECGDPVQQDVVSADVLELVHQDEAESGGIKTRFPVAGQDEPATGDAADRRGASGGPEDGVEILTNP
jgi:hypothetical protein